MIPSHFRLPLFLSHAAVLLSAVFLLMHEAVSRKTMMTQKEIGG